MWRVRLIFAMTILTALGGGAGSLLPADDSPIQLEQRHYVAIRGIYGGVPKQIFWLGITVRPANDSRSGRSSNYPIGVSRFPSHAWAKSSTMAPGFRPPESWFLCGERCIRNGRRLKKWANFIERFANDRGGPTAFKPPL